MTAERGPMFRPALRAAVFLIVLFFVVYGACNRITAYRSDVGTWVYSWEHLIPFVPLMIIPYVSIDLLFVIGPFLCSDRSELSKLSRRIALSILIAAAFFLIMPLRFTFERPPVSGWLGVVFNNFRKMDLPYNQFPSLHIALRTILAELYGRHTRGMLRWISHVWFSLIGASTLLVYQHHVADIAGGFALAWLCFYLVNDAEWRHPVIGNPKIGAYYLCGAAIFAIVSAIAWPWTAILLWPAVAFGVVGGAYFGLGLGIFRKHRGRLPFATRMLLEPVIFGQQRSLRHYAKRSRPWDAVTERLWIGRTLNRREAAAAKLEGVSAVLDLTAELPENDVFRSMPLYHNLPIMDLTEPSQQRLREAVDFITQHSKDAGIVYVHCKAGYSRSAAVVVAYLLHSGACANADEAIALLRIVRAGIVIRPEAEAAMRKFEASLR